MHKNFLIKSSGPDLVSSEVGVFMTKVRRTRSSVIPTRNQKSIHRRGIEEEHYVKRKSIFPETFPKTNG